MKVTDIRDRLRGRAPRLHRWPDLGAPRAPIYSPMLVHEGVVIHDLVKALTSHGLTLSNVPGHGVVIHRIGQDPSGCAPHPPKAS